MKTKIISIYKLALPAMVSSLSGLISILVCTRLLGRADTNNYYLLAVFLPINYVMIALYESIRAASLSLSSVDAYQGKIANISLNMASLILTVLLVFLVFLISVFLFGQHIGNWIGVMPSEQHMFTMFSYAMFVTGIVTGVAYVFTSTFFAMKKPVIGMSMALLSAMLTCLLTYYFRQFILPTWLSYVVGSLIAYAICVSASWVIMHQFGVQLFSDGFNRVELLVKNIKPIIKTGAPVLFSSLAIFSSLFFINATLSHFGSDTLTGYSIAYRIQNVVILPAITMGTALAILSSRARVEGDKTEENHILRIGLGLSFLFYLLVALLVFVFRENIMALVTTEKELIKAGSVYLKLVALSYVFMGPNLSYLTLLEQSGAGLKSFFINVFYFLIAIGVGCIAAIYYQHYEYLYITIAVINILGFIYILSSLLVRNKLHLCSQSSLVGVS